jgi:spore coat protein YsxE
MKGIEWQAKHLLYEYDLFLHRLLPIGEDSWKVDTDRGSFFLKKTYEHPAQLYFVAYWLQYLHNCGIQSVTPFCMTKYGEPYIVTHEGIHILQPWIKEVKRIRNIPDWGARVLQEMARIHRVSEQAGEHWQGYAPVSLVQVQQRWTEGTRQISRIARVARRPGNTSFFARVVNENEEQVRQFAEWAEQELQEVMSNIAEDTLPQCLCHGRIHRRHVRVGRENQIYFTNFERANFDTPVRDLAIFFRRYGPGCEWNVQRGKRWLSAYEMERPLREEERRLLCCYLLYPERMAQVARTYWENREEEWEQKEQACIRSWRKHLRLLPKMRGFALAMAQK